MMIQLIIFIMGVVGIQIANFILGGFLSTVQVESTEYKVDESKLFYDSNVLPKNLASQELCKSRTSKKILNNRLLAGSEWVEESPSADWTDNNMDNFNELASECLQYFGQAKESENFEKQVESIDFKRPILDVCDYEDTISQITYYPSDFGAPHNCGSITYNWPQVKAFETELNDTDEGVLKNVIDKLEGDDYKNTWSLQKNYNSFKSSYLTRITTILDSDDKEEEKNEKLIELYSEAADGLKNNFEKDSLLPESYDTVSDFQLKANLIYLTHLSVSNFLLGGTLEDADFNNFESYLITENEKHYGVDYLRDESTKLALDLERVHCAYNWEETQASRKTYLYYNGYNNENSDLEDFINSASNGSTINFECMNLTSKNGDPVFEYVFMTGGESTDAFNDLYYEHGSAMETIVDDTIINDTSKKFREEYAVKYTKRAALKMATIAGYNYMVKKAAIDHMSEKLKENSDFSVMIETRKAGFASLGSMLLKISKNMVNASEFANSINTTSNSTNMGTTSSDGYKYYSLSAFMLENQENIQLEDKMLPMEIGSIMNSLGTPNTNTSSGDLRNQQEDESGLVEKFFTFLIEDAMFSSIDYIKAGSGMNLNSSLLENLKECSQTGDCISSQSHPLNTMMMFGHQTIENITYILLTKIAIDFLLDVTSGADPSMMKKGGSNGVDEAKGMLGKIFSKLSPLGVVLWLVWTVVQFALMAISGFLDMMMPFLYSMIFVGVLCGYLLPIMPYMLFTLVFIGWLISVFVVTVATPILLLRLAQLKENGDTSITIMELWQITGNVLLKPPLLTIAMIFAWTLSSVTIYFINTTMFIILESTMNDSNLVSIVISYSISYILYVFIIYIALQHSFQIITSFGDEVSQIIGVSGSGDQRNTGGLNLERLLAANLMSSQLSQGMQKIDQANKGNIQSGKYRSGFRDIKEKYNNMLEKNKQQKE